MPWEDFKRVYDRAYELGCKGVTTFNPGGKRFGVLRSVIDAVPVDHVKPQLIELSSNTVPPEAACTFDLASGRKSCE
jgi:ribonucleoside-diphosphate reductase alpha chain